MQPVGELDQQHPNILGHGEEQLAQVLRLGCFLGDQVKLLDLGQAVDQGGDLAAELLLDFSLRLFGILDDVMKESGGDGRAVELHFGQYSGDLKRMIEERLAGSALLPAMGTHGIDIGAVE